MSCDDLIKGEISDNVNVKTEGNQHTTLHISHKGFMPRYSYKPSLQDIRGISYCHSGVARSKE
jgi:hypothetical protein